MDEVRKPQGKIDRVMSSEQPLNWTRAFLIGSLGAIALMALLDTFTMLGVVDFSLEIFVGSMLRGSVHGVHNWTVGFIANLFVGGLFGMFYAYFFEYVFKRSSVPRGLIVGLVHSVVAALAVFPFFQILSEQIGAVAYPRFGFFGFGQGLALPALLLVGHLIYGATMGLLYGPVRLKRVRLRDHEPGERARPWERDAIRDEDDPVDRVIGY